ncbi:MAG: FxLYD domain-containing protein [Acidobacteriota bacterium]
MPDVKISPAGIVIGLAGILIMGVLGWLTFGPPPIPPAAPKLTQEARAYLPQLALSNVHMQAAENYVNARLVEILGEISNKGNRTIKVAEVTCVFSNYSGVEIARERALVVGGRSGSLAPGETKSFRLPFDTIPETWNQALPTLIIAQIQFE